MPPLGPDVVRRQAVIGASAISPDGERIVYTRRTVAGDGYRTNLWLVAYRGGRPRRLTHGRWSDSSPVWSPDGRTIAFVSDRGAPGKRDDEAQAELFLLSPDGGEAVRVCAAPYESVTSPAWSPDGRLLAFVGTDVPGAPDHAENSLWVWDGSTARSLTAQLDIPTTVGWASDLHDWMDATEPPPRWDGGAVLAIMNRRGRDEIWRAPLDGDPEPVTTGDTTLSSLSVGGGRVAATGTGDQNPPDVCAGEGGSLRRLTRHGGDWLRRGARRPRRRGGAGGGPPFPFLPPPGGGRAAVGGPPPP